MPVEEPEDVGPFDPGWDAPDDDAKIPSEEEILGAQSPFTDAANADAVCRTYPRNAFLYVTEWDSWITWDGHRWRVTGSKGGSRSFVTARVIRVARERYYRSRILLQSLEEENFALDPMAPKKTVLEAKIKHEKKLLAHLEVSQNAQKVAACITLLQDPMSVSIEELDKDPWLFNVANGTVDLRTGEIRPYDRTDLITNLSAIEYDPDAQCPNWEKFLATSMGHVVDMVDYLQRVVGYEMTGVVNEHCLFFHYGLGSNGKSTFRSTIQTILGDYACTASRELVVKLPNGNKPHPAEIARLYKKRFVGCAEIDESDRVDEGKVKDLTGGDVIACRRMSENWWDLYPTHKLDVFGNHRPEIRNNDHGMWRRIRLIPWLNTISERDKDVELTNKLKAEAPGILTWAIRGCLAWQKIGLKEPHEVQSAVAEYRADSDVLGQFVKDCVVFEPTDKCPRKDIRSAYELWCEDAGYKPLGARKLAERLRSHGVRETNIQIAGKFVNGWKGVRLKTDADKAVTEHEIGERPN